MQNCFLCLQTPSIAPPSQAPPLSADDRPCRPLTSVPTSATASGGCGGVCAAAWAALTSVPQRYTSTAASLGSLPTRCSFVPPSDWSALRHAAARCCRRCCRCCCCCCCCCCCGCCCCCALTVRLRANLSASACCLRSSKSTPQSSSLRNQFLLFNFKLCFPFSNPLCFDPTLPCSALTPRPPRLLCPGPSACARKLGCSSARK